MPDEKDVTEFLEDCAETPVDTIQGEADLRVALEVVRAKARRLLGRE